MKYVYSTYRTLKAAIARKPERPEKVGRISVSAQTCIQQLPQMSWVPETRTINASGGTVTKQNSNGGASIVANWILLPCLLAWGTTAVAALTITTATVRNGVAFVQGGGADRGAEISWEGMAVATASKGKGDFSFFSVLPPDCSGQLSDGGQSAEVQVLNCSVMPPVSLAKTGPTEDPQGLYSDVNQKGVAWPDPRFTDNADGTITDHLTGLVWLRDGLCLQDEFSDFANMLQSVNALADGDAACSLSDGSAAGDWRMPNVNELQSLRIPFSVRLADELPFVNLAPTNRAYYSSTIFTPINSILALCASCHWIMEFVTGAVSPRPLVDGPGQIGTIAVRDPR